MEQTLFWTVSVFVYIYPYFYYFSNSLLFLVSETFFLRSLFFSGSSFRNSLNRDLLVVNCLSFKWTVISFTVSFCAVGLPTTTRGCRGKESTCQYRRWKRCGFDPWARKIPWSRKWQLSPVFFPGKFHGQRRLAGYSPWDCKEWDTTQWLSMHMCAHTHVFIRNWRCVAILNQASPSVLFFLTAFAHFIALRHILVILTIF